MTFDDWLIRSGRCLELMEADIKRLRRHWRRLQGRAVPNEEIAAIFDDLIDTAEKSFDRA